MSASPNPPARVIVSGGFDDLKSLDLRFLEEAAKLGAVTVWLWPDSVLQKARGRAPQFPLAERDYFLRAVRHVSRVTVADPGLAPDALPETLPADIWADYEPTAAPARAAFAARRGIAYRVFGAQDLSGFPEPPPMPSAPGRKKVVATGCYDWVHSGHVRFCEEASTYGDLYLCLGNDANVRMLKGPGHPLLRQEERRYVVGSLRFVKQALITSGSGWLDADPEIRRLKPDYYIVNEDGDKGGKKDYCRELNIAYVVLKRRPAPGLPPRSSTALRGF